MANVREIDEALVRRKAFELWEARGRPPGSADEDWFTAMREFELEVAAGETEARSFVDESAAVYSRYLGAVNDLPLGLRILSDEDAREPRLAR